METDFVVDVTKAFHTVVADAHRRYPAVNPHEYLNCEVREDLTDMKCELELSGLNVECIPLGADIWPSWCPELKFKSEILERAYKAWVTRCARFKKHTWEEFLFCLRIGLFLCYTGVGSIVGEQCKQPLMDFVRCLKSFTPKERTSLTEQNN